MPAKLLYADLDIWIYDGQFTADRPTSSTYAINKAKLTGEQHIRFEISELIKDYIDVEFNNNYSSISTHIWVYWRLVRAFDDLKSDTTTGYRLASTGYGYFKDGINPVLGLGKQMDNQYLYVPTDENVTVPVYIGENGVSSLLFKKNGSTIATHTPTLITTPVNENPDDLIVYYQNNNNPDQIVITYNGSDTQTITVAASYEDQTCSSTSRFTPYKVSFINKYGVVQDIWFYKKRKDSISIQRESYRINTVTVTNDTSINYNYQDSTDKLLNIDIDKSFSMNTGYINEEYNQTLQELLISEHAWITEGGQAYPIIPQTGSLSFKTSLNDKLIDYTIDFKYGFNEVNIIR
jgi:hypothetical protein